MQKLDTYGDIKKYTRKTIFASFFVNCIINIVFLFASCYAYFILNTLIKTKNIYSIIAPTILILILYGFTYTIVIKRDNLILNIGRFFDYIFFRHIIKTGIIINARTNNTEPAKKLIGDVIKIKTFLLNKCIIGLFDIPWIFISILIIGYFSLINAIVCLFCIVCCSFLILKANKYTTIINTIKSNENYDFIHQLFKNSQFVQCNFDYENVIKKTAVENTLNYKHITKYNKRIAILQSILKFIVSVSQIAIFLISVFLMIINDFTFGEFILTIILTNRTLNVVGSTLQSIIHFSDTIKAYSRINDAIEKTYNINTKNTQKVCNELKISMHNVSYLDFTTQKEIFDNLNGEFVGGEIYVVNDNNKAKIQTFLKLISGLFLPTKGTIYNCNIDNGYDFISYYQQEPTIINSTILDFISGFEEQIDLVKINNIIKTLNIEEIKTMKYSLNTLLQSKHTYSKEFLRKLNLARIIYRNTNVIILEEPFENIDDITAKYLVDYINTYKKLGKMVILSADNLENEYIKQLSSINIVSFQQTEE